MASDAGEAATTAQRSAWEIRALEARGRWTPTRLTVERLHADAFQATADGSGIDVSLPDLDTIKAQLTATAPGLKLSADAAMLPQTGGGKVSLQLESAETRGSLAAGPALRRRAPGRRARRWRGQPHGRLAGQLAPVAGGP